MKLSYKIFGSFLLTIILSLFLMVAILRIHAAISFSNFINDRLIEKMVDLKEKLIVEYNRNSSWEFLRSEPHQFRSLVERSIDKKDRFRQKPGIFHERHRPMTPEHGFDHRPNPRDSDDFPGYGPGKAG